MYMEGESCWLKADGIVLRQRQVVWSDDKGEWKCHKWEEGELGFSYWRILLI